MGVRGESLGPRKVYAIYNVGEQCSWIVPALSSSKMWWGGQVKS